MLKTITTVFCFCAGVVCSFGQGPVADKPYSAVKGSDELLLSNPQGRPLLTYRYTVKPPPPGDDEAFVHLGDIHPLQTITSNVLTNIHPTIHYPHYCFSNP